MRGADLETASALLDVKEIETLNDRAAFIQAVGEGAEAARAGDLHPNDKAMKIEVQRYDRRAFKDGGYAPDDDKFHLVTDQGPQLFEELTG